jgi:hypothetical protein
MSKPYRTTLSLPAETGSQLEELARSEDASVLQIIRAALNRYLAAHEVPEPSGSEAAREARSIIHITREFNNPYQELVGSWRVTRTHRQLQAIGHYQLDLDAWSAETYLMKILTDLIHNLDENDDFLTITNTRFWSETATPRKTGFLGRESEHFYLGAQREAIAKGMRLHRVFVISEQNMDENRNVLRKHRDFLESFSGDLRGRVNVGVVTIPDNLDEALRHYGHFACLRRGRGADSASLAEGSDDGCLIVRPMYDAAARITSLRFIFSRGAGNRDADTKFYIDRFREAENDSDSIDKVFSVGNEAK